MEVLDPIEERNALIESNIKLTSWVVDTMFRNAARNPQLREEMVAIAQVSITEAAQKYDPTMGTKFSTYAVTKIRWDLSRKLPGLLRKMKTWNIAEEYIGEIPQKENDYTPHDREEMQYLMEKLRETISPRHWELLQLRLQFVPIREIAKQLKMSHTSYLNYYNHIVEQARRISRAYSRS